MRLRLRRLQRLDFHHMVWIKPNNPFCQPVWIAGPRGAKSKHFFSHPQQFGTMQRVPIPICQDENERLKRRSL